MVISVAADFEGDEAFALVQQVRAIAQDYYPDSWYLAGQGVSTYDLMDTITGDMAKVNLVAIAAVFLVLLVLEHSLILPILLVLSIETAIWFNLALPYFTGTVVFYIAYLIISSVQLGATVDYAILFSDRYREYRETPGQEAGHCRHRGHRHHFGADHRQRPGGGGLPDGAHLHQPAAEPAGHLPGGGQPGLPGHCAAALPGILYLIDPLITKRNRAHPPPSPRRAESMKSASFARRAAAAFLAAAVLCASALPAFAEGEAAANTASKEEVIYGKLALTARFRASMP